MLAALVFALGVAFVATVVTGLAILAGLPWWLMPALMLACALAALALYRVQVADGRPGRRL